MVGVPIKKFRKKGWFQDVNWTTIAILLLVVVMFIALVAIITSKVKLFT